MSLRLLHGVVKLKAISYEERVSRISKPEDVDLQLQSAREHVHSLHSQLFKDFTYDGLIDVVQEIVKAEHVVDQMQKNRDELIREQNEIIYIDDGNTIFW